LLLGLRLSQFRKKMTGYGAFWRLKWAQFRPRNAAQALIKMKQQSENRPFKCEPTPLDRDDSGCGGEVMNLRSVLFEAAFASGNGGEPGVRRERLPAPDFPAATCSTKSPAGVTTKADALASP